MRYLDFKIMVHLSLARVERAWYNIGTTVWSKYCLVGRDCRSTLDFLAGFSAISFSAEATFYTKNRKNNNNIIYNIILLKKWNWPFSLPKTLAIRKSWNSKI